MERPCSANDHRSWARYIDRYSFDLPRCHHIPCMWMLNPLAFQISAKIPNTIIIGEVNNKLVRGLISVGRLNIAKNWLDLPWFVHKVHDFKGQVRHTVYKHHTF